MWGLLIHTESVADPLRQVGRALGQPVRELPREQFTEDFAPVTDLHPTTDEERDVFGFSQFYCRLSGREMLGPVKADVFRRVKARVHEALGQVEGVLVWGNSWWLPRMVTAAARELGKPVMYVEQGWFRAPDGEPTYIVDPVGVYTQGPCLIDREWEQHDTDCDRVEGFIRQWMASRQTKHPMFPLRRLKLAWRRLRSGRSGPSLSAKEAAKRLAESGARALFVAGQVAEDAAQYWGNHLARNVEELCAQALEHLPPGWTLVVKPHPFDFVYATKAAARLAEHPRVLWTPDANIHDLLDLAEAVLTINSNVGLEASLYRRTVILAGEAVYGKRGFTRQLTTFADLPGVLSDERGPSEEQLSRFVDYVVSVYLVDPRKDCSSEIARRMGIARQGPSVGAAK
ncbi:MAG: hypothetical protein FJX75_16255 [Armatimonadetes bacterium]|nr:hypothetical protein [Armatimonadota bacterium]